MLKKKLIWCLLADVSNIAIGSMDPAWAPDTTLWHSILPVLRPVSASFARHEATVVHDSVQCPQYDRPQSVHGGA